MGVASRVARTIPFTASFSPLDASAPNRCLLTEKIIRVLVDSSAGAWLVTNPKQVVCMIISQTRRENWGICYCSMRFDAARYRARGVKTSFEVASAKQDLSKRNTQGTREMTNMATLTDENFDAMEREISQSETGRLFLDEYTKRHGLINAHEVMTGIKQLQVAVASKKTSTHIKFLRHELQEMGSSIARARSEIAALQPEGDSDSRIVAATEELGAIVTATETATNDILAAAESILETVGVLRQSGGDETLCDSLENQTTNIFMACSFQDITGQRTNKVVNVMRYLEQRIEVMMKIWEVEDDTSEIDGIEPLDKRPDAHLLEGPQVDGSGMSQGDVNRMIG